MSRWLTTTQKAHALMYRNFHTKNDDGVTILELIAKGTKEGLGIFILRPHCKFNLALCYQAPYQGKSYTCLCIMVVAVRPNSLSITMRAMHKDGGASFIYPSANNYESRISCCSPSNTYFLRKYSHTSNIFQILALKME